MILLAVSLGLSSLSNVTVMSMDKSQTVAQQDEKTPLVQTNTVATQNPKDFFEPLALEMWGVLLKILTHNHPNCIPLLIKKFYKNLDFIQHSSMRLTAQTGNPVDDACIDQTLLTHAGRLLTSTSTDLTQNFLDQNTCVFFEKLLPSQLTEEDLHDLPHIEIKTISDIEQPSSKSRKLKVGEFINQARLLKPTARIQLMNLIKLELLFKKQYATETLNLYRRQLLSALLCEAALIYLVGSVPFSFIVYIFVTTFFPHANPAVIFSISQMIAVPFAVACAKLAHEKLLPPALFCLLKNQIAYLERSCPGS